MTADLLAGMLRAQVAASLLILLVLAVRRPVRARAGARTAYGLWLLPLFAAAASLLPSRVRHETLAPFTPEAAPEIPAAAFEPAAQMATAAAASPLTLTQALLAVWMIGALASLVWIAAHQARCRALMRAGALGPAVIGFWRPRIVLPADFELRYDEAQRALILEHEEAHLQRQDPRVIGLVLILRALAWFNPLAYVAVRKLRIDQEMACDETVLNRFPKIRRLYAETLAKSQLANRPLPLGCYWPTGTEHPFLERIAMLKSAKIGARRRLVGAGALGALCAASGLAAWAANPVRTVYETAAPAPAAEIAPAPRPQASAPRPTAAPSPKAADSKAAEPQAAEPQAAAPAEVCLTNACAEALAPAAPREVAERCAPPCRVNYIGSKLIPAGSAFVTYFDAEAPVLVKGRIAEVMLRDDGVSSEFVVVSGEDGRRWRVVGGTAANMPDNIRAVWEQAAGSEVVVRGYQTHDKTCDGGACIINGRDVTRADGSKFGEPPAAPQ